MRGHPFIRVPRVYTDLSTRRVLVSEYVEGERFEAVRRAGEAQRDRYGEIVFRFFFGLLYRDRIALGDPHPGQLSACVRTAASASLTSGCFATSTPAAWPRSAAIALAVRETDAGGAEGGVDSGRLSTRRSRRRRRCRLRAEADAPGDQLVRGAGRASLLARPMSSAAGIANVPKESNAPRSRRRSTSSRCRPTRS